MEVQEEGRASSKLHGPMEHLAQNHPPPVPSTSLPGLERKGCNPTESSQGMNARWKREHGTGNSSYGQTRRGVRWVSGNNQVREKNKSLYGRNTRRKIKEKVRIGMSLVLRQSHSGELWSRSQDQVGHRSSWSSMSDAGNKYANKTFLPQWQQRWKQFCQFILCVNVYYLCSWCCFEERLGHFTLKKC